MGSVTGIGTQLFLVLSCTVVWIILAPIVIPVYLIFMVLIVWRKTIDFIVWLCHPRWRPIKPPDSMFAATLELYDNQSIGNIGLLVEYDNTYSVKQLVEGLRQQFRSKIMKDSEDRFWKMKSVPKEYFGFYYWVPLDDMDDLTKYIHEDPSGIKRTEAEINDFLTNQWMYSSYEQRSPWELIVVDSESGPRVCFRMNHMIGGAFSLRSILEITSGIDDLKMGDKSDRNPSAPRMSMGFFKGLYHIIILPWTVFYIARQTSTAKNASQVTTTESIMTRHVIETQTVKKISKHFKCAFRSVLVHGVATGLRKYERETCTESSLPDTIEVIVSLPWPYSRISKPLNNKASSCTIIYPVKNAQSKDRGVELIKTHKLISEAANQASIFAYYIRFITYIIPACLLKRASRNLQMSNSVSDFPASKDELMHFGGYLSHGVSGLAGINRTKIGCLVTCASLGSKIRIGMFTDVKRTPTVEAANRLFSYVLEELNLLENIVDSKIDLRKEEETSILIDS